MAKKAEIVISAKNRAKQAFDAVDTKLQSIQKNAGKMAVGLAAAGATAVVAGLVNVARETAKIQDEAIKTAQSVGLTTESLTGLQYAAELSGGTNEALSDVLRTLSKNAYEAGQGVDTYAQYFDTLGINVHEANGTLKDADTLLLELADSFTKFGDTTQKTAIADALLGGSGTKLIPLLNQGSAGIREMTAEAERLGIVIDTKAAKESEKFNDNMTRLSKQVDGAQIALGNRLLPALSETAEYFLQATQDGLDFVDVLGAIGIAVDRAFNGALIDQQRARVKELEVAIVGYDSKLATIGDSTNKRLLASVTNAKQRAQAELKGLQATIANADAEAAATKEKEEKAKAARKEFEKAQAAQQKLASANKSAVEADARAARTFVDSLNKQAETLGLSRTELIAYDAAHLKLSDSQRQSVNAAIDSIDAFERQAKAIEKAKLEATEMAQLIAQSDARELAQLEEKSAAEVARLDKADAQYQAFFNELEQANASANLALIENDKERAIAQLDIEQQRIEDRLTLLQLEGEDVSALQEKAAALHAKQLDIIEKSTGNASDAAREFGLTMSSAFEDAALNGEKFGDVLDGLLEDIARMALRKAVTDPISNLISGAVGSIDFGSLFANANGGVYTSASLSQYSGQIVDSPKLFAFANGAGLMGEAGPEAILPLQRGPDGKLGVQGGGGAVVVNIYNQANGAEASVQEREEGGMRIIDVMVKQVEGVIADGVESGNGRLGRSIQSTFGLNRAGALF